MSEEQTEQKYTKSQAWGALRKCWRGYRIAKNRNEYDNMVKYAGRIRNLQKELSLKVAEFPDLGLLNES